MSSSVPPTKTGIKRLIAAFGYSLQGLRAAFVNEEAFRLEVYAALILLPLAIFLGNTAVEKSILIMSFFLVPLAELLNSAIEAVVDRFGNEWHELSKRAKDIGSASVLLAMLQMAICWVIILLF